jgi:hypothetical protein
MDDLTFGRGQVWKDYLASMTSNRALMERKVAEFRLENASQFDSSAVRAVLAFTEDWCSDSVTAFPPLITIARVGNVRLRVMRRSAELALQQSLTGIEYPPIPTLLFYDGAWRELGRFVEMPIAFRRALQEPADAVWLREMYDELWWQAEVEELAAIFAQN